MSNLFKFFLIGVFTLVSESSYSQCSGWNNMQVQDSVFTNPVFGIVLSLEADRLHRPYVYVAANVGGLKVYDKNSSGNPLLISSIPTTVLGNLNVINLYQDSIWLYLCLGNIWDTTQMAGLAIIDISNPMTPLVLDYYVHPGLSGGAGAVAVRGNFAYLAANDNGLVILNISNKNDIQYVSSLSFSINFPHTSPGLASMYNARGIDLGGNYAFICFDRGGLRVADISDVNSPYQYNQYCFSNLIDKATAYNNIVVVNNTAYVAIDYYGLEILDISNPSSISQIGWWHPATWADTTNDYNIWSNSQGHCNELAYDSICHIVYVASGKSDVVAIDVSNPSTPTTCQTYGTPTDDYGTWGTDFFNDTLNLAYIWSPFFPPYSNYTGFKTLSTYCSSTVINELENEIKVSVTPNPASDYFYINYKIAPTESLLLEICNSFGKVVLRQNLNSIFTNYKVTTEELSNGVYFWKIYSKNDMNPVTGKIVHIH